MNCALSGACVPDLPDGYKYVDCDQCNVLCSWCCLYVCKQHVKLIYEWGRAFGNACHKCIASNHYINLYDHHISAITGSLESFIKSVQEIHSSDLTKNTK